MCEFCQQWAVEEECILGLWNCVGKTITNCLSYNKGLYLTVLESQLYDTGRQTISYSSKKTSVHAQY